VTDVRREKGVGLQWVQFPPGNWVAPAGSYRGGRGGNETVGAFETIALSSKALFQSMDDSNRSKPPVFPMVFLR